MIDRYENDTIRHIWTKENKVKQWQDTELAVIGARVKLGRVSQDDYDEIASCLYAEPVDIVWWLQEEKRLKHDLNAFVAERRRLLPVRLRPQFHKDTTSYDTEEPAFVKMLDASCDEVSAMFDELSSVLIGLAKTHRLTVMNGRTHGQEAELQTFGKRCLTWLSGLRVSMDNFYHTAAMATKYAKISGAIGNYTGIDPDVEREALAILGLEPFYGATQILPRELFAPLAHALYQLVLSVDKVALDIRLGARSGCPIYQEPFAKQQTGSSAMPHKKNTISTEQLEGMARLAEGYCTTLTRNVVTWEERAIEQSCAERVAWPDLLHVVVHCLKTITRVLEGLKVYPDNMLKEVVDSCGCYASAPAKEFLAKRGGVLGIDIDAVYRIVQLAAFNALEPLPWQDRLRENLHSSFEEAGKLLFKLRAEWGVGHEKPSIQRIISHYRLCVSPQLEATQGDVDRWNSSLERLFTPEASKEWDKLFLPSYLLRNEAFLFGKVLGED